MQSAVDLSKAEETKAGFTPGPWETGDVFGSLRVYSTESGLHQIATCAGYYDRQTANANARLIAAAPDLAVELRDLVDWLDRNQRSIEGEFSMEELLEAPRAVLIKAGAL